MVSTKDVLRLAAEADVGVRTARKAIVGGALAGSRAPCRAHRRGRRRRLRPGELRELRVRALDLSAGEVRITRADDEREKVVKTPKTGKGIRTVTIPATLMPLLERIARERTADDRVCPVVAATPEKEREKTYREHLQTADVDHAPLLSDNYFSPWTTTRFPHF